VADGTVRITSIRYFTAPRRKAPATGDLRETKKHGKQIRLPMMARDHRGRVLGYLCNGGRQNYEWASYAEARARGYESYVPKEAT